MLQPLSREHHTALTLAKACQRAAQSGDETQLNLSCQQAIRAFENDLEPHFQIEEVSLLPLLQGKESQFLAERTLADHQLLRELTTALRQSDAVALEKFGKFLAAHVRFEERELFPILEGLLHRK